MDNLEVQGTMSLVVNNDDDAHIRVSVTSGSNKGFQFKTHPNIDKNAYASSNVLGLKDPTRPFPTGSELGILKWRFQTKVGGIWCGEGMGPDQGILQDIGFGGKFGRTL